MRSARYIIQNPVVCSYPCLYTFPTTLAFLCRAVVAFGSSSFMSNAGLIRPLRSSLPTSPVVTAAPYCAPLGPVKNVESHRVPIVTRRVTNSETARARCIFLSGKGLMSAWIRSENLILARLNVRIVTVRS